MILLGAVYSDNPERNAPHAKRIATEAKSLIYSLDQVCSLKKIALMTGSD
jgi:hypothetical protein